MIEATPHDAIVRIDGKPITDTTGGSPFVRTNLAVGSHLVEVERDGFLPWHTETPLPVESVLPVEAPPEPTKPRRPKRPKDESSTTSADLEEPFGGY